MNFNIKKSTTKKYHTHFYSVVNSHKRSWFFKLSPVRCSCCYHNGNNNNQLQLCRHRVCHIMKRTMPNHTHAASRTSLNRCGIGIEPIFSAGIFCKWAADPNSDKTYIFNSHTYWFHSVSHLFFFFAFSQPQPDLKKTHSFHRFVCNFIFNGIKSVH